MKKYIAECFGTMLLTFMVALSLTGSFALSTPVLAILVVGLMVYAIGHISGAHLNPAITVGAWSLRKIGDKDALAYLAAQFLGAWLATVVMGALGYSMGLVIAGDSLHIGIAEFVGTLVFGFGVAAVIYGTHGHVNGIIVAIALLLGITLSILLGANGVVNPAVAFGIGSMSWMYVAGPILGAIVGMHFYKFLQR